MACLMQFGQGNLTDDHPSKGRSMNLLFMAIVKLARAPRPLRQGEKMPGASDNEDVGLVRDLTDKC